MLHLPKVVSRLTSVVPTGKVCGQYIFRDAFVASAYEERHVVSQTHCLIALSTAALLGLTACAELDADPDVRLDAKAGRTCMAAVKKHTGAASVSMNTTLPVVEVNQYIVDVAGASSWTCLTDDNGQAQQFYEITG